MEAKADFIPCPTCLKLILRNKQRCPFCGSIAIWQQRTKQEDKEETMNNIEEVKKE